MASKIKQICSCGQEFEGRASVFVRNGFVNGKCRKCIKKRARLQGMHLFPRQQRRAKVEKKLLKLVKGILTMITLLWSFNAASASFFGQFFKFDTITIETAKTQYYEKCFAASLDGKFSRIKAGLMPNGDTFSSMTYFVEGDLGLNLEVGWFYGEAYQGIAYLSQLRRGIATKWQFPTTVGGGLTDGKRRLGFIWEHFSNGTNSYLNTGVEYMGVELGFKF